MFSKFGYCRFREKQDQGDQGRSPGFRFGF